MIAHNPLHGSGRAALPHPALALGNNAHAAQGIGMTDGRQRQPASDEAPHAIPTDATVLAAPRQRAMPEPPHLESKKSQRRVVHGHSVIPDMPTHHRLQPLALFGDGVVHSSLKLGFHLVQLRLQPLAYCLPQDRKPSVAPLLYADMRKAKKVERLRFPFSTPRPAVDRIRTEFQKSRLLGMQFQVELPHSFGEFRPKLIGIRFAVKSNHDVIRVSHHDQIAVCTLLTPRLDPQVEYVMKIDVRQKRRGTSALGRPFLRPYSFPILQHAGSQPFLDKPHDAPVCYPVLDELHKPFVGKPIEKAFDVQIKHPVHFSRQQSRIERIQRLMLASPWPEPIRKTEKVRFVDSVQHLDRRALDDFVFQRRDSERSLPRRDRTQALYRWAAGSGRYRLLVGSRRCLIPRLDQFPTSPRFIPDGGFSPIRLGTAAFPLEPSHIDSGKPAALRPRNLQVWMCRHGPPGLRAFLRRQSLHRHVNHLLAHHNRRGGGKSARHV